MTEKDDDKRSARSARPSADWKGLQDRVTGAKTLLRRFGGTDPMRARSHELDWLDKLREFSTAQEDIALVHARDVMGMTFEEIASVTSKGEGYWRRRYETARRRLRPTRGTPSQDLDGGLRDEWETLMKREPNRLRAVPRPAAKSEKRSSESRSHSEGIIDIRSRRRRSKS